MVSKTCRPRKKQLRKYSPERGGDCAAPGGSGSGTKTPAAHAFRSCAERHRELRFHPWSPRRAGRERSSCASIRPSAEGTARRQAEAAAEQKRQQLTLLEVAPKDIESYASTHGLQDVPAAKEAVAQVF